MLEKNTEEKKNNIGIMLGRLSSPINNQIQAFPITSWKEEFSKASLVGFDVIEWIFDTYENPIMDDNKIHEIKKLSETHSITINAVCADYFMIHKLFGIPYYDLEKNLTILKKLIKQCSLIGIKILELPFVDSSSIKNIEYQNQILQNLKKLLPFAKEHGVYVTLETDLEPHAFQTLLTKFEDTDIKANYDVGNSVSLGYDMVTELKILRSWIANIHVKDRLFMGKTVPLGTGNVNFDLFFETLSKIQYKGDLIIQGAREDLNHDGEIKPEQTCTKYYQFVKQYVHKYL